MESNYSSPLTLDELAHFSCMSKYHLSREFKKYIGFSPNQYLIELRLSEAKLMLETTSIPAYKIGAAVGIADENNFISLFRKKTGMTPSAYRKQLKLKQ